MNISIYVIYLIVGYYFVRYCDKLCYIVISDINILKKYIRKYLK